MRVGISEGEFVILSETSPNRYHGHIRQWKDLSRGMKNGLYNHGLVRNLRGKFWK